MNYSRVMLRIKGQDWGTAAEIATALGPDVTPAMVRRWADRDGLVGVVMPGRGRGTVWYPLDRAAQIERAKRQGGKGRPRQVDKGFTSAGSFVHSTP